LSLKCLDGCAYCCLCMPEVMANEEEFFRRSHPKALSGECVPHAGRRSQNVILQGDAGACHFLKSRKCAIYEHRPQMCRQYPISIYLGRKIQPTPILSCRGLVTGAGNQLAPAFAEMLKSYNPKYLESELRKCESNFNAFRKRAEHAGAYAPPEEIYLRFSAIISDLATPEFLASAVTFAGSEGAAGIAPEELRDAILSAPPEDLNEYVRDLEAEAFEQEDPANLPVFIDRDLIWRIFSKEEDTIVEYELTENGNMAPKARINFDGVSLLPLDAAAGAELINYLQLNLRRDFFYDVAALAAKEEEFERHLAAVYLELLAQTALSVWWRASLVAKTKGAKTLDKEFIRDGIVFYDADFLDSDSIGEFI
ncbi:MAG: hypothetical protein CVT47_04150, partial [Thermoplasmata archaeon HGW-Thermoplasmata-2]